MKTQIQTRIGLAFGLILALLAGLAPRAEAANRYWIATSAANWTNTANWSATSGGTGNAGVPGAGDVAIFDGAGGANGDCNINATVSQTTGGGFNIGSGYGGTISQGAVTITVGSIGWTQAGGTFNGGSNPININGPVALSGGTFKSTSGTLTHNAATWTSNTGTPTFNANGGTVTFNRTHNNAVTVASGSIHFNNVYLMFSGGSGSIGVTGTMYVDGTLTLADRATFSNGGMTSGTIEVGGNLTMAASYWGLRSTGLVKMTGTVPQTISSTGTSTFPPIEVAKSAGTLVLSGANSVSGWTWTSGALDASGSTLTVVVPYNTPITVTPGTVSYNNVGINVSGGSTTVTISGTWDVNGDYSPAIRDNFGSCKINTGTINVAGNLTATRGTQGWGASTCAIVMDGTGSINAPLGIPCASLTVNTSGTISLAANLSPSSLTWTSGALNLESYTLTVANAVTIATGATTLGVTVAGASPSNGRLTCSSTVSGINNVALAMTITATPAQLLGQTYTILSNTGVLSLPFEPVSWLGAGGPWTGTIAYSANSGKNVTAASIESVAGTPPIIDNLLSTSVTTVGASFNGNLIDIGTAPTTVSVRWANTEAALTGVYSSWAWAQSAWGNGDFPTYSGASLTANTNYYYTFVAASSVDTTLATPAQYLITGELTPVTTEGTCGVTAADTATISISRPGTCVAGALTVNYALSGAGTSYVSASPASGFTLTAGQASTNIVFTPLQPNMGAPLGVTLTMLPGAYASDGLDSDSISVATAVGYTLTANTDTSIGSAMDVVEDPPNTVAVSVAGSTNTYEFWASSLNLNGKRIYNTTAGRSVVLTNLAVLTDSGVGRIDTSTAADFTVGGGVTVQAAGGITLNGANGSGYAIDSSSTAANGNNRWSGGDVTLIASGGVSLSAGGVRTQGRAGGRIWITDGAGGSAGNVSIVGNLYAASTEDSSDRDGSVQVRGATVTIAGNVVTTASGADTPGKPITLVASGPLSVGGYLAAEQSYNSFGGSGGAVSLTGTTVTVSGSLSGLSINTSAKSDYDSNVGGNIRVTATAGDLTLAGGVDASHPVGISRRGAVALSAPGGNILVGSLDASKFKSISVAAGGTVRVTGVITNFPVDEPSKKITFPANSVIGNHIYYDPAQNTAYQLTGDYAIYVGTDTGKLLKEQTTGSVFRFR